MAITLYRRLTHQALAHTEVEGRVLDLGGSHVSGYLHYLPKDIEVTVVNTDVGTKPDVVWDLEQAPYPFWDETYDVVLAVNVLEHIWGWRQLLAEVNRILASNGELIIAVPFLHAVHPSPHDYMRFTKEALVRACTEAGFSNVIVKEIGCGVFASSYSFFQRFIPSFLSGILERLVLGLDVILRVSMNVLKRKYTPEDYPLGYMVIAKK